MLFFQRFKYVILQSSVFYNFWLEVFGHSDYFLPICKLSVFSACFHTLLFFSGFWQLTMKCPHMVSSNLSCLNLADRVESVNVYLSPKLEIFRPVFLQAFILLIYWSTLTIKRFLICYPTCLWSSFHFFFSLFSSLFFRLDNFY